MKKIILQLLSVFLSTSAIAQSPAGTSLYIDYDQYQSDGLLRYTNCGNNDILNPGDYLSMEAWVKVSSQSVNDNIKIFGKFGLDNTGYLFGKEASELYCEMWTPSQKEIKAGFLPPMEHWAHMVCTFAKGGQIKAYVNGLLVGEQNAGNNGIAPSTNNLIIGIAPWDLSSFQYFGALDNIRIWNKELSANEVRYNMHHLLEGTEEGLIADFEFEDNLLDNSIYANNGTGSNISELNYQNSNAVIANESLAPMNDIHAVWLGLSSGSPLVNQITENGLTVSAEVYGDEHVLFGHNNLTGISAENLPTNSTTNFMRQNREWYIQSEGLSNANLNFSLSNGSVTSEMLNGNHEAEFYTLLYRESEAQNFTAIKAGNVKIGDVIAFLNVSMINGYYTIAVGDEAITELLSINETKDFTCSIYPNPSSGAFIMNTSEKSDLVIVDVLGKSILYKNNSTSHKVSLNTSGLYFANFTSADGTKITKQIMVK